MDPQAQLDGFIDKFAPGVAQCGHALLDRLKRRLPGATILVYDNYNALAIGFAAEDRAGTVVLSIALYPKWINLFFLRGVELEDRHGLLRGEGSKVRHIPKITAESLDDERIDDLIEQALAIAQPPIGPQATGRFVIKSISARQRPRRPKA